MLIQKGKRKVVRKAGNNGLEAYRQLCLMYGTSDQEGSTGLFVQIMTYKFGSKIEDVEDRLNEFLELVRRYDEANGTDPVPDQVKNARIISNTSEPLKTHLQLNVPKLGNFNGLRVVTEDYLRSRRVFKTTSARNTHDEDSMEVDAVKEKSGKSKKGGKKGKESHSGVETNTVFRPLLILPVVICLSPRRTVPVLSRACDHSSNAPALAQAVPEKGARARTRALDFPLTW